MNEMDDQLKLKYLFKFIDMLINLEAHNIGNSADIEKTIYESKKKIREILLG